MVRSECSLQRSEVAAAEGNLCGGDARAETQLMAWKASSFSHVCSFRA